MSDADAVFTSAPLFKPVMVGKASSEAQPLSRMGENPPYGMIGDRGEIGIIRSPVRASTLSD